MMNGNVTATGGKTFSYDSENHLISMTASGTSARVYYDPFGNPGVPSERSSKGWKRVAKTVSTAGGASSTDLRASRQRGKTHASNGSFNQRSLCVEYACLCGE